MMPRKWGFVLSSAVGLLAAAVVPVIATEPAPDLQVLARVESLSANPGGPGATRGGEALITVTLESFSGARDIQLDVERADGSPLATSHGSFTVSGVSWSRSSKKIAEQFRNGAAALERGESARLTLSVPVSGEDVQEIVLKVAARTAAAAGAAAGTTEGLALGGTQTASTKLHAEAMVRIALGNKNRGPVDDGTVAEFPAVSLEGGGR